ncbi:hypothetical protein EWB00_010520 [Schistosoma japonicum]|uniref:Uncharacterized protein n=1 Tax=Schistosoma japonicum TaxID=6182 RepID=A0A4Z2DP98_SCHJA|nr:hypothetical protein EWB00_010520 [Schistosoma japonicum]
MSSMRCMIRLVSSLQVTNQEHFSYKADPSNSKHCCMLLIINCHHIMMRFLLSFIKFVPNYSDILAKDLWVANGTPDMKE